MLVLNRSQVEQLLDPDALVDAVAAAMADLSAGRATTDRIGATVPERAGVLFAMPGYVPSCAVLMTKLVSLFPHYTALPTHQAVIVAFDPDTGRPIALLDGTAITALRTAAGSALSARLLARADATDLAILGTGVQARTHAAALCRVRPIARIRVAGRDRAKTEALAAELDALLPAQVSAAGSYAEAMDGADVVCATTHADEPVVRREWLPDGVHVASVGFNVAGREVDAATVRDALVCVESRHSALGSPSAGGSNDLMMAIRDGVVTADHVGLEIGELVAGTRAGRTSAAQITLYKSVGVAAQDAAAVALTLAAARDAGIGTTIAI